MQYLKKYEPFKESILIDLMFQDTMELLESMTIWHDALLSSIDAEEVDIFDTLNLPSDEFSDKLDLEQLEDNVEFINSLSSIALKKSEVQNSDNFETFLNKPCRFMFIYGINRNELEEPSYLLFQSWQESFEKWDDVKLYKINDSVSKFYNTLNTKTIEITDDGNKYIYQTSNGANEWVLQNKDGDDNFKKTFRKNELEAFLDENKKFKVNIIN